jgi:hypothetical protein
MLLLLFSQKLMLVIAHGCPPLLAAVVAAEQAADVAVSMLLQQCILQSVSYNHVRDLQ